MLCFICLLKIVPVIVKALKKNMLYFTKNIFVKTNIRPDIRYPVSGFWISRISGKNSIRCIPSINFAFPTLLLQCVLPFVSCEPDDKA
jgi:hypothetical protein